MENTQLVIAEKPSVARAISQVLEAGAKRDGYWEGRGSPVATSKCQGHLEAPTEPTGETDWLVSWCVGHLVELAPADAYDPRYSKWNYNDLPIIPHPWQYRVLPDTQKQFDILRCLMGRDDVDTVVCATDAGREGELIFRLVYDLCGCTKPIKRLWISSMEEPAICRGFDNLLDSASYDNLYAAALCRAKADWLVGINATRLFTTLYKGKTLNVGRVLTPTLALLVEREAAIAGFQKEKFYTVELKLNGLTAVSERFSSKTAAERLRKACLGTSATVTVVDRKERTERPPALYDLTTLQREANRLLGYTAQQTLDYLQSLYEKRLATYPRTDSRYLTDDMEETARTLAPIAARICGVQPAGSVTAAQVCDSGKVTDHHALIPTRNAAGAELDSLPTGEREILRLVALGLVRAVSSPYQYAETVVTAECGGHRFTARGRTVRGIGWRAYAAPPKCPVLPELAEGQRLEGGDAALKVGTTAPPAHFNEDTLLAAMERTGAEDMPDDAAHKGLGTPATRAATIEKLVRSGFVVREGRQLIPTQKGIDLIRVMPDQLKSAKLTAEWEERLGAVERGELPPDAFMNGIVDMVRGLVQTYAGVSVASAALSQSGRAVIGKCPRCGKNVVEGKKSFFCEGYYDKPPCGFALWKNDRFFTGKHKELTKKIAASLLKNGCVALTGLFSEKKGVFYDATVVLDDDGGKFVRYKVEFDKEKGHEDGQ